MFEQREQRHLGAIKSQKPVCRSRSNIRTRQGTMDWFKIGKGVYQGCILSPCLFNLYAEYIMRNAGLQEAQARIKIARKISITSDMQMTPPLRQKAMGWKAGGGIGMGNTCKSMADPWQCMAKTTIIL